MKNWFAPLWSSSPQRKALRPRRLPLRLERLEDRLAPAVITVTGTGDTIALDTFATLREAITSINNQADINNDITANRVGNYASLAGGTPDVIHFNIPGSGVQTIAVTGSAEPTITRPLTIDGYSQTGASANTLANADNAVILIQLDGTSAGAGTDGLTLGTGSAGSTIKGLDITNFHADASFNGGVGILVQSNSNSILGNFVGVDPTGTTQMSNGSDGIRILDASNNQIGTTNPVDRNISSGNILDGIHVEGTLTTPATGNTIQGNFVGVGASGVSSVGVRTVPIPNAGALGTPAGDYLFGIEISGGNSNTIGGSAAGARNVVGFCGAGIEVDNGGQQNVIQGNFSGVGADGTTPVGNLLHGIVLRSSNGFGPPIGPAQPNEPGTSFNTIGGTAAGAGNVVEFNGTGGIAIFGNPVSVSGQPNVGNAIEGNAVFENGRNYLTASSAPTALLGIDLTNQFVFPRDDGPTPNDTGHPTGTPPGTPPAHGDPSEPNNFQNAPVLTSFFEDGTGKTDITGTLTQSVSPNTTFRIEFFANDPDPLNLPAEGQQFLGFVTTTTNASGKATFSAALNVPVTGGRLITATATDPNGNTSEFSPGIQAATTTFSNGLLQFSGGITSGATPTGIVQAADGNFWFTEFGTNALGRITPTGLVTEFSLASLGTNTAPLDLVSDPANGFLYFTLSNTGRIARINPMAGTDAQILASESESAVVPSGAGAGVHGITVGPDGNLWFTENSVDKIANVDPTLTTIHEFSMGITAGAAPVNIVTGPDGALWFTESNNAATGAIGRITTAGVVTNEFLLAGAGNNNDPEDITVGPDGALWFTEAGTSQIGRITTAHAITTFTLPTGSNPEGITSGPFGQLYFAESGRDLIGSITTTGVITELGGGTIASGSQPTDVTIGGSRALWFTEAGNNGNTIGRFFGLNAPERAVQSLYIDALGRAGSVAELDGWVSQLPAGATSLTPAVVSAIEGSFEARDRVVKGWYVTYLGRQAQGGEEQGFVNALQAGLTEEQVLSQVLGGTEFFNHAQNLIGGSDPNSNYVQALYQLLLGRTGSPAEVGAWANALQNNAVTRQQVASIFLGGTESRGIVVAGYYSRLLHRAASPMEISGWVNSGLDEFSIRVAIETTPEFFTNG
jgi:streptogramin lyase